jgi:glycosyltransferase involved in cell wall biosynthesis
MSSIAAKRIAVLLPSLRFGGAERVALNLSKALKSAGVSVDILLMSKQGEFLVEAEQQFQVTDLECNRTYKLPGRLLRYLRKQRPDVLIASFWKLNLCACLVRVFFPKVKVLLWEHSPPSTSKNSPKWLYALTASILYQLSSRVVAVSTGVYNDIERLSVGIRRKLVIIPNPINPPSVREPRVLRNSRVKRIISVGRLDEPKNPQLLLDAFALIFNRNLHLQIVGDGRFKEELVERSKRLGIEEHVNFLGYQANPYDFMLASDLLVVSSDREGLPTVIIEAMHCGLRVVSTDCGEGVRDILLGGRYGTIVPTKDKYGLARGIITELSKRRSVQEQKEGAQRFLPNIVVQRFLSLVS